LFSSFIGKKFSGLSLILCLLSLIKVRQFFGGKFFEEKRSAAADRNSKGISLENKEKNMCLAAVKTTMKGIAVCLGFQTRTTQRHLSPPPGDRDKICLSQDCLSQSRGMDTYKNT
jgi:hypothetical protein